VIDPRLPIDQQHVDDDIPEVTLDENGDPIVASDDDYEDNNEDS